MRAHQFIQLIARAEVPILILLAPALLLPSPRFIALTLALPGLWWCAWATQDRATRRSPLDIILLLFLVMILVSLFATYDISVSLNKITGALLGLAAYYAVVRAISTRQRLWAAVGLFILAGAGLALIGILGTNLTNKVPALNALM